jgi:hypothetical protein
MVSTSKPIWDSFPQQQKLDYLFEHVAEMERVMAALATTLGTLERRLEAIENRRPGTPR